MKRFSQIFFIMLLVTALFSFAVPANAQLKGLGGKLKNSVEKTVKDKANDAKRKAKSGATVTNTNSGSSSSTSGNESTSSDNESGEVKVYSTFANPNEKYACCYKKTYKPSAEAIAADPDATSTNVAYGFTRSTGDIHAYYENFDKAVSLYQPYYTDDNKFFWELGGDNYQKRLGFFLSYMKKNLAGNHNNPFIPAWAEIDSSNPNIVVPADETFINPWYCQYIADPKSKTAFILYIYAFSYSQNKTMWIGRQYNYSDPIKGYVSDTKMVPANFRKMTSTRADVAFDLAMELMPIETMVELAKEYNAKIDDQNGDAFSRYFNYTLTETLVRYFIEKHDKYDTVRDDNSIRAMQMMLDSRKSVELYNDLNAEMGPEIDEPKGVAVTAAIKAAGTKAGKEYAGDKFEKVIYLESKWRTLKNPQYPYNIIGYVLNCATVTKRGDKRQLQYTVLTKSPDGSRYFMQAASDASYYNLK